MKLAYIRSRNPHFRAIVNKLGITDPNHKNEFEAEGLLGAELFTFNLEEDVELNLQLILDTSYCF